MLDYLIDDMIGETREQAVRVFDQAVEDYPDTSIQPFTELQRAYLRDIVRYIVFSPDFIHSMSDVTFAYRLHRVCRFLHYLNPFNWPSAYAMHKFLKENCDD